MDDCLQRALGLLRKSPRVRTTYSGSRHLPPCAQPGRCDQVLFAILGLSGFKDSDQFLRTRIRERFSNTISNGKEGAICAGAQR